MNDMPANPTVRIRSGDRGHHLAKRDTAGRAEIQAAILVRLWAVAVLFHLAANPERMLAAVSPGSGSLLVATLQVAVAGVGLAVVAAPTAVRAGALGGLYLIVMWLKLPVVGNHEVILGLVALAMVVASARAGPGGGPASGTWAVPVVAVSRWILVVSYSFIAFSKLNRGFFDPTVSCAAVFADEFTGLFGFSPQAFDRLDLVVICVVAAVELMIPVLLVSGRFRARGAALGLVFHGVLALDPVGHVWDFSASLVPLFVLFLPVEFSTDVADRARSIVERVRAVGSNAPRLVVALVLAAHVAALVGPAPRWLAAYPAWLMMVVPIIWRAVAAAHRSDRVVDRAYRMPLPAGLAMNAIVGLGFIIGIGPYLGVRSSAAFNMYSNLQIFDGRSNHYLIGALPAGGGSASRIVWADPDSPLEFYVDSGLAVPNENLRRYLADAPTENPIIAPVHPQAGLGSAGGTGPTPLMVRAGDAGPAVADEPSGLGRALDLMRHKLAFRRAVDPDGPVSCRRAWGPAG